MRQKGGWTVGGEEGPEKFLLEDVPPFRNTSTCNLGRRLLLENRRHRKGLVADG